MPKMIVILTIALIMAIVAGLAGCSSDTAPSEIPMTTQTTNSESSREEGAANDTDENTTSTRPTADAEKVSVVETAPQVGKLAPDFTFTNSDGKSVSLSDLRDRFVILNFWATWCGPCKYEMPLIQDLAHDKEKADKGLILLTINSGESADAVGKFMKERGFSFTVLLDTQNSITRAYNVRAIPTTFFIGQDGIISEIKIGAFMHESELKEIVDRIMK